MKKAGFLICIWMLTLVFGQPETGHAEEVTTPPAPLASAITIDGLYVHTYGKPQNQSLLFVHGGPGFDSWGFELTQGQKIADMGYYVVVYDERGQGRSEYTGQENYTFAQSVKDIKLLIERLNLHSPLIMGHSFGGPIVVHFEEAYPGLAKKIILISGTIDEFMNDRSTYENCKRVLAGKTQELAKLDKTYGELFAYETFDGRPASYIPAPQNPAEESNPKVCGSKIVGDQIISPAPTPDDLKNGTLSTCQVPPHKVVNAATNYEGTCSVYKAYPGPGSKYANDLLATHPIQGSKHHGNAELGFYQSPDSYAVYNGLPYVAEHSQRFCGLYGQGDGLVTPDALKTLGSAFKVQVVENSGHNIFLDHYDDFFNIVQDTCGI